MDATQTTNNNSEGPRAAPGEAIAPAAAQPTDAEQGSPSPAPILNKNQRPSGYASFRTTARVSLGEGDARAPSVHFGENQVREIPAENRCRPT